MKKRVIYQEIERDIIQSITNKELKINDQIMTEEQLSEKYGVSRMTINKAISNLVRTGYIYRIPGKGSFVRNPQISKNFDSSDSFTNDMKSLGLKPGSKLLEYSAKRGVDFPLAAEKLNLSGEDLIHYFVRLRTGDDLPMAISYTYVSSKCITAIDLSCLENSFYDYVDNTLGLVRGYSEGEMTARMPTPEQAELLQITNDALLLNTHVTYLDSGVPMEYILTYYVGSRYAYYYSHGFLKSF